MLSSGLVEELDVALDLGRAHVYESRMAVRAAAGAAVQTDLIYVSRQVGAVRGVLPRAFQCERAQQYLERCVQDRRVDLVVIQVVIQSSGQLYLSQRLVLADP